MNALFDFERFVLEKSSALVRYCAAITCGADAEDAAQEAFVRLWKNQYKLTGEVEDAVYLYRAAYSACIDILRSKKRFRVPVWESTRGEPQIPEGLFNALAALKPVDRAILYGRAVDGKSYAELASQFNHNEAWVRKRYSVAKIKLKKILSHDDRKER